MKNKLLALALSSTLLFSSICAFADTLTFSGSNITETNAILAMYDANKALVGVKYCEVSSVDGKYQINLNFDIPKSVATYKVVFPKTETIVNDVVITTSKDPSVTTEPTTAPTVAPTVAPTTAPTENPTVTMNPIYPKQVDAVNAFAVVKKVTSTVDENNDESVNITCYYQGREVVLSISNDITITSASDAVSSLANSPLTSLKRGDVITFQAKLTGKIETVNLVYRPQENNVVLSDNNFGTNFEKLFSINNMVAGNSDWAVYPFGGKSNAHTSYAFGVIQAKNNGSIVLYNKGGLSKDAVDLSIENNTVVYTCDMTDRTNVEIGNISSVQKSTFAKAFYDTDDNITEWDTDGSYFYALARIIDGTVTDIIVYQY